MLAECIRCHGEFELGYDGTWQERRQDYYCDNCAGVERDEDGYAGVPFNLVNEELRPLNVKLVPHEKYEYALRFKDNDPGDELINAAKQIVDYYNMSEWFDDEMSEVDEW